MEDAGCRAAPYAYSDTAAVTSCSRQRLRRVSTWSRDCNKL